MSGQVTEEEPRAEDQCKGLQGQSQVVICDIFDPNKLRAHSRHPVKAEKILLYYIIIIYYNKCNFNNEHNLPFILSVYLI